MEYDEFNRLVSVNSSGFTNVYYYTGSELTGEQQNDILLEREYGPGGRTESISASGYTVTNVYDDLGRTVGMLAVVDEVSFSAQRSYLEGTSLLVSDTVAGRTRICSYEPFRDVLTSVANSTGEGVVSTTDYFSDAAGHRITKTVDGVWSNSFNYDRNQLGGWASDSSFSSYYYDEIGNRIWWLGGDVNSLNQYTDFEYDLDGNMTRRGEQKYVWDAENRLAAIEPFVPTNGDRKVQMDYDHLGRMIRLTESGYMDEWMAVSTRRFVWDGWNPIAEIETDLETGQTNRTFYVWGPDISGTPQGAGGVGGLVAVVKNQQVFVPCYDGNGNITEYVDSDGMVVARYRYDHFGVLLESSGPMAEAFRFRFSTKYHEPVSGLVLYQKRAYCPELGRWLSRDPIGEDGGLNLYAFCENNPITKVDRTGENIYLITGNNSGQFLNDLIHQSVCVDSWDEKCCKKVGKICFSFGYSGVMKASPPKTSWLGFPSYVLPGYLMRGIIYESDFVGDVSAQKRTTCRQDRAWLEKMRKREGLEDVYSALNHNCRKFSQYEFSNAP